MFQYPAIIDQIIVYLLDAADVIGLLYLCYVLRGSVVWVAAQ